MNSFIKKLLFIQFCIILILSISCRDITNESCNNDKCISQKSTFKIIAIRNKENGWAYDIMKDNKIIIHQPNIPAIEGFKYFSTSEQAIEVAKLVVDKLNKNIFPPSLTISEINRIITRN